MQQANARIAALNAQTDAANAEVRRGGVLQGKGDEIGAFKQEGVLHRRWQAALAAREQWRDQVGQPIDAANADQSPDTRERVIDVTEAAAPRGLRYHGTPPMISTSGVEVQRGVRARPTVVGPPSPFQLDAQPPGSALDRSLATAIA